MGYPMTTKFIKILILLIITTVFPNNLRSEISDPTSSQIKSLIDTKKLPTETAKNSSTLPQHPVFFGKVVKVTPLYEQSTCDICETICDEQNQCSFVMMRQPCVGISGYLIDYINNNRSAQFFSEHFREIGAMVYPHFSSLPPNLKHEVEALKNSIPHTAIAILSTQPAWIRVKDGRGSALREGILLPGDAWKVSTKDQIYELSNFSADGLLIYHSDRLCWPQNMYNEIGETLLFSSKTLSAKLHCIQI